MTDLIIRRQNAPFGLVRTKPFNLVANDDVIIEAAALGSFRSQVRDYPNIVSEAPSLANTVCRYDFRSSDTGSVVTDISGAANHGTNPQYYNAYYDVSPVPESGAVVSNGWGRNFNESGDASARRFTFNIGANISTATSIRFIVGFLPTNKVNDTQYFGRLLSASGLQINRLPTGQLQIIINSQDTILINGFFINDEVTLGEFEIFENRIIIYRNGAVFNDTIALSTNINISAYSTVTVANQSSGGRAFGGYISHLACYVNSRNFEAKHIRYIYETAKADMEISPRVIQCPTLNYTLDTGRLKFETMPSFSTVRYVIQHSAVTFKLGLANDPYNSPVSYDAVLNLNGNIFHPKSLTFIPTDVGTLTFTQTIDNGIDNPVSKSDTLEVVRYIPPMFGNVSGTFNFTKLDSFSNGLSKGYYVDRGDAGFPYDLIWDDKLIVDDGDNTVGFRILPNNTSDGRPLKGSSMQFQGTKGDGTGGYSNALRYFEFSAYYKLIDTRGAGQAKGYVQTSFTFTNPYTLPRWETDFEYNSKTGRMECSIHLQGNEGGSQSIAKTISMTAPEAAFTGFRKWTIVRNPNLVEWYYEDVLITRYIRGVGWDSSVQNFELWYPNPLNVGQIIRFLAGNTFIHPNDAGWQVNPQSFIIQQWNSNNLSGWIGNNNVPLNHPLLKVNKVIANGFGIENTKMGVGDWTATAGSAGQIIVTPTNYPAPSQGSLVTETYNSPYWKPNQLEYSIDDGTWTRFANATLNTAKVISGVASGSRQIRIRPVGETLATNPATTASTYVQNSNPSDIKTVTVI